MSEVLKAVTGLAAIVFGKDGKDDGRRHVDEKGGGQVSVKAQLDRRRIDMADDYDGHLMVSVTGSDEKFKRTPICTVLVLDVSTSMSGPKLALLKETAAKVAQNLTEKDEIAIVAFGSHVETVLERTNASNRDPILAAISRLQVTGCTNLSGGFQQGLCQVNERFKGVKRIMLLTDGMANEGIADRDGLLGMVKGRDSSCTLSTFGFGMDCDQELLADMAKAGGGNYYFISGKDIKSVFARELGGMLSCIGQNLEVRIRPSRGGEVLEVLNDFTVVDDGGEAVVNAEDLFAGETKHVLVRFRVAKPEGKPKARPFSVAHVTVSWDGVKSKKHEKFELNPKATFVKGKDADAEPVIEVAEQVALIEAAKAQLEAVEAAERGDFAGAQSVLRHAGVMFAGLVERGSEAAKGLRRTMKVSAMGFTAAKYDASYGSTVSNAAMNATRYRKGSGEGDAFLSANVAGTRSMDALEADFTDGVPDIHGDMTLDPVVTSNAAVKLPDWQVGDIGPIGDQGCIGYHSGCHCPSCSARRDWRPHPDKIEPVSPVLPRQPTWPSKPDTKLKGEAIHKVDRPDGFAKRSKRWDK